MRVDHSVELVFCLFAFQFCSPIAVYVATSSSKVASKGASAGLDEQIEFSICSGALKTIRNFVVQVLIRLMYGCFIMLFLQNQVTELCNVSSIWSPQFSELNTAYRCGFGMILVWFHLCFIPTVCVFFVYLPVSVLSSSFVPTLWYWQVVVRRSSFLTNSL